MSNTEQQDQAEHVPFFVHNRRFYELQRELYGDMMAGKRLEKKERREEGI